MTEPISKTQVKTQTAKKVQVKPKEQQKINSTFEKNEPSTAKLAANRLGAVVFSPLAVIDGTSKLTVSFLDGVFNPNKSIDKALMEGRKEADKSLEKLDKMWEGRYF